MNQDTHPVVSDFTPFNPFLPPVGGRSRPSYQELLATALGCVAVTVAFFAAVHFWR